MRLADLFRRRQEAPAPPRPINLYNKLVRDKIIQIIIASGDTPIYRNLKEGQHLEALTLKGVEEMNELMRAILGGTQEQIREEFVDVLTVLIALHKRVCTASYPELRLLLEQKLEERGGFDDGVFLEGVQKRA